MYLGNATFNTNFFVGTGIAISSSVLTGLWSLIIPKEQDN